MLFWAMAGHRQPLYVMKIVPRLPLALILTVTMMPAVGLCGGDWDPVRVESFKRSGESEYVLVLHSMVPDTTAHRALGNCKRLEIHGTYSWWHSWRGFPKWVNRKLHQNALAYLEAARTSQQTINFGWMGQGLVETDQECVFRSRALELYTVDGKEAVISYHNHV